MTVNFQEPITSFHSQIAVHQNLPMKVTRLLTATDNDLRFSNKLITEKSSQPYETKKRRRL